MATDENILASEAQQKLEGATVMTRTPALPRVRLARDPKIVRAKTIEEGGGTEAVYHTPPTASGVVNIYGVGGIYLPSLSDQKAGFTPRIVKRHKNEWWKVEGSEADATRILLEQFPGIFKPVEEKGA